MITSRFLAVALHGPSSFNDIRHILKKLIAEVELVVHKAGRFLVQWNIGGVLI